MSVETISLPDEAWQDVEPGTEALLEEWLVASGDSVQAGQSIAIVVMVKTSIDVVAPANGAIGEILVAAGGTIAKGMPLATIETA